MLILGSKEILRDFNEICGGSTDVELFLLQELKGWFLGMKSSRIFYRLPFFDAMQMIVLNINLNFRTVWKGNEEEFGSSILEFFQGTTKIYDEIIIKFLVPKLKKAPFFSYPC